MCRSIHPAGLMAKLPPLFPAAARFVGDSPLEGDGFEPPVPAQFLAARSLELADARRQRAVPPRHRDERGRDSDGGTRTRDKARRGSWLNWAEGEPSRSIAGAALRALARDDRFGAEEAASAGFSAARPL